MDGGGGRAGQLLVQDTLRQGREVICDRSREPETPDSFDECGHDGVALGHFRDRCPEAGPCHGLQPNGQLGNGSLLYKGTASGFAPTYPVTVNAVCIPCL